MKIRDAILAVILNTTMVTAHAQDAHLQHHQPAHDRRVILELSPDERAMILEEMRMFLSGIQRMTGALAKPDMLAAAEAARGMGQKMVHDVPPALRAKLPLEFRQLGFSVHRDFDQIALDAESLKDVSHSLNQLSDTLQKCVSCHATYQIQTSIHTDSH